MIARLALVALVVAALAGCTAAPDEPDLSGAAADACKQNVTPQFDEPDSVVWPKSSDVPVQGDVYTVLASVRSNQGDQSVTCELTVDGDDWFLLSYSIG